MPQPARKPATYEDLCAVPEDRVAEIIDGELLTFPRPALLHSAAATALGIDLGSPFQRGRGGPGGWVFHDEPELHLGGDILVPDLAGWRIERAPNREAAFATTPPDWLCEVLSPSTHRVDRVRKLPIYLREKVGHVWLVDPRERTLEIFRRQDAQWVLAGSFGGDDTVQAEPFEAVPLELAAIWGSSP